MKSMKLKSIKLYFTLWLRFSPDMKSDFDTFMEVEWLGCCVCRVVLCSLSAVAKCVIIIHAHEAEHSRNGIWSDSWVTRNRSSSARNHRPGSELRVNFFLLPLKKSVVSARRRQWLCWNEIIWLSVSLFIIPLPSCAASSRWSVEIGRGTTTSVEKTDFWKRDSYLSLFSQPGWNVECWNNRKNSSTSKKTSAFSISVRSQSHMTEISMRSRPIHASWIPVCLRLHKHIFPIDFFCLFSVFITHKVIKIFK